MGVAWRLTGLECDKRRTITDRSVARGRIQRSRGDSTSTSVTTAAPITLTVTAQSSAGIVGKVELYEGVTLLGTQNAVPADFVRSYVQGDNGAHTYTAKAYTASANATSPPLAINVGIPADACGVNSVKCAAASCPASLCVAPSHVATGFGAWASAAGIQAVTLAGGATLDGNTGAAGTWRAANANATIYEVKSGIGFVRIAQAGNEPAVAVWVFKSAHFTAGAVAVTGNAAAVLASAGNITVDAAVTFDLGAKGTVPGPGGFLGGKYSTIGAGCAPGGGSSSGGGGAGFGSSGQAGGGGAGGPSSSCDAAYATLVSLRGGSGGGGGDDSDSSLTLPFGGGGGGALQITSMGDLVFNGVVHAGGGGGRTPQGNSRSGAGGGSGGAIFLESPTISLGAAAGLYTNGGGAGSTSAGTGSSCGATPFIAEDGKASLVTASGSHCGGGFGGNGAAASTIATAGSGSSSNGGGGGGVGRIVLRTLPASTPTIATTNLSPTQASAAYQVVKTLGQ